MSQREWHALPQSERAFLINSYEFDILPGAWGDLDDADQSRPVSEVAEILLGLVDRGWIEVHPVESEKPTLQLGLVMPRDQLTEALHDPENWEYLGDSTYVGGLKLVLTEAGDRIARRSPEEMADPDLADR